MAASPWTEARRAHTLRDSQAASARERLLGIEHHLRLAPTLPVAPAADIRAQRGRDVATARHAGGHRDARPRRQRGRRRARHRDHAHAGRALQQRPRVGSLRDPVDRQRAGRIERVGPRAARVDAGALRRQNRDARTRLGDGHDPRRGLRLARVVAALRRSCRSPTCSSRRSATRATAFSCRRSSRKNGRWRCRTCRAISAGSSISCRAAARRIPASGSRAPRWRPRSRKSRAPMAKRSIAANWRRRW